MSVRRIKIVNSSAHELRVAVVFRECDLISSHSLRSASYSQSTSNSSNRAGSGSVGYGGLSASASSSSGGVTSQSSSSSSTADDTLTWNWNNFIIPGSVLMDSGDTQIFSVPIDKPIHYLTIINTRDNKLICEHFPTDATNLTLNQKGMPVPDINFEDEMISLRESKKEFEQLKLKSSDPHGQF